MLGAGGYSGKSQTDDAYMSMIQAVWVCPGGCFILYIDYIISLIKVALP